MILKDVKLMLNNGKRCVMRSGQADDSRKAAVYFRQIAQEDAFTEMMADEVPDVYEIRKMLQHFETAPREVMVLAWVRKQIIGCGMLKLFSRIAVCSTDAVYALAYCRNISKSGSQQGWHNSCCAAPGSVIMNRLSWK